MPKPDPVRQLRYLKAHPEVKNIRRYEIMQVLIDFAKDTDGPTPLEKTLWRIFNDVAPKYGFVRMGYPTFLGHMQKLIEEGIIEKRRGVICIVDSEWKPPSELPIVNIERPQDNPLTP